MTAKRKDAAQETVPNTIERNVAPWPAPRSHREVMADYPYIEAHREELTRIYPDEWVVVLDAEIIGHGQDHQALVDGIRARGLHPGYVAYDLMETEPLLLIL